MILGGSKRMIIYDDVEVSEKIKVYDKGIDLGRHPEQLHRTLVSYRVGDMSAPKLESVEALQTAVRHFLDCVRTGRAPLTGGESALRVLRVLEAGQRSLQRKGRTVRVAHG
jgi:predicted dehydrogenase